MGVSIRSWATQFFNFQYYRFPGSFSAISNLFTNLKFFFANYIIIGFIGVLLGAFEDIKLTLYIGGCCIVYAILLHIKILTDSKLKKLIWTIIFILILYFYVGNDILRIICSILLLIVFHALFL